MKKIEKGAIKNYCKENRQQIKHNAGAVLKVVAGAAVVGFAAYFGSVFGCKDMFAELSKLVEDCTDEKSETNDFPTEDIIEEIEEVAAV